MNAVILILVIIAALFAIAGGVWVAIALVRAVSAHRDAPESRSRTSERGSGASA